MDGKKVFISYSHDTPEHTRQVLQLANALRGHGVDAELDQYQVRPALGWPRWCEEQLRPENADFVLVVCTGVYRQRVENKTAADEGRGVFWEGGIIYSYLYNKKGNQRFIPVLLPGAREDDIPRPLRDDTRYHLSKFDLEDLGYRALYRELTGQPAVVKPPVGTIISLSPDAQGAATINPLGPLPAREVLSSFTTHFEISRIIKYAPDPKKFPGRDDETKILNEAWDKVRAGGPGRPHILSFVALGGEGKTSLVAKWVADLAGRDWPGCEAAFAWSFYSQGARDQAAASSDLFLREALIYFGDSNMAESAAGAFDKGTRLARLAGEQRALLILDGLEPLQYAPTSPTPGELKDAGIAALLKGLAAMNRGLCVVTTRYSIHELRGWRQTVAPEITLKRLSREAGVELLKCLGVKNGSQADFEKLVEDVDGHALTLQIMGGFLKKAYGGDIRRRDLVRFEKADAKVQGGHAFRAMAAYEKWMSNGSAEAQQELALLRLLGLFDRPATADCLAALLKAPAIPNLTEPLTCLAEEDLNCSLDALESTKLLTINRDPASLPTFHFPLPTSLDAHPLLREYFAKRLREEQPAAWAAGHKRLFEHLCETTREGDAPSLEALQPLYQAVAHGCQAGLHKEACAKVYRDRILRGTGSDGHYSARKLGAFASDLGAIACFFETPWHRVSSSLSKANQAWLLNEAGTRLRALGRLTEALEPMQAGLEMNVKQEDWKNAAARASNLSELELSMGKVASAVADAGKSVNLADRSSDVFQRMINRTTHADALHQAGQRGEAEARFREAEQMQAERQPGYPLLYSQGGFRYCDLLLAGAEREAGKAEEARRREDLLAVCRSVAERAGQTLKWAEQYHFLLDIALNNLTLGRVALYAAILDRAGFHRPPPELSHLDQAVAFLRRSGDQDILPLGLLTRAWLRRLTLTGTDSSQSDLDEAWEIAERGPMPLFLADIHLYRARLFGRLKDEGGNINTTPDYPWESPQKDLAEARRLIEKHGYWRRKEELEDAEKRLL